MAIRATGLCKTFATRRVLIDVSFELRSGEVVLLRGANGSGKSTLMKILSGAIHPDSGAIDLELPSHAPRPVALDFGPSNSELKEKTPEGTKAQRGGVVRMSQELRLFSGLDAASNVAVASPNQLGERPWQNLVRHGRVAAMERAVQIDARAALVRHGFTAPALAWVDQISLGQAKRVDLARAIQTGARVLLLDEPLAGLDGHGANALIAELIRIHSEAPATLVVAEHDLNLGLLVDIATTVWTIADGQLIVSDIESVRSEILARACDPIEEWSTAVASPSCRRVDHDLGFGARLSIWDGAFAPQAPALALERIAIARGRGVRVPPGPPGGYLSFKLAPGQFGLLQAPNGWGKSTILETIAGLIAPSGGSISIAGHDVTSLPPWRRPCTLHRDRAALFPRLSVREVLALGGIIDPPAHLAALAEQRIGELSGGERQKVGLSLAFSRDQHSVHLLDEPLGGLDAAGRQSLFKSIRTLLKSGAVLVAVPTTPDIMNSSLPR